MMCSHRSHAAVLAVTLLLMPLARGATRESFDITVPAPPSPVAIDGGQWLIYELHLTNFSREPLRITKIDVLDGHGVALGVVGDLLKAGRLGQRGARALGAERVLVAVRVAQDVGVALGEAVVPAAPGAAGVAARGGRIDEILADGYPAPGRGVLHGCGGS